MIPKDCKRLAEIDFPIAEVSRAAVAENAIRHAHPKILHIWWARRPLASCRAMLLALLLPDPCDDHCPEQFKEKTRALLPPVVGSAGRSDDELRAKLLKFIGDFSNWKNVTKPAYIEVSRALIRAAYPEDTPLAADPFAGGGSIPLEALRIGCEVFASDLNPVACVILKTLLQDIPRHGPELADELRRMGAQIRAHAERELAEFYPRDPDGAQPIAYLWARTVRCEASNCGAEIPLMRSFWLSKKAKRKRALRYSVVRSKGELPRVEMEIFEPKAEAAVPGGTVAQAKAKCICCGTVLRPERVRAQLAAQHGGADVVFDEMGRRLGGAQLIAVVTIHSGEQGRTYRLPTKADYAVNRRAVERVQRCLDSVVPNRLSPFPDEIIPKTELRRISVPLYGVERFRDLYTARQLLSLSELAGRISATTSNNPALNRLLALCLGKTADLNNANTRWKADAECPVNTIARHDIPAAWDFAESAILGEASGSFFSAYERTASSIPPSYVPSAQTGIVQSADAAAHPLPDESASIWFTDPPYYDAVPYAHLSDFFYVWEKRALCDTGANAVGLTPKDNECVVDRPHSLVPEAKTAAHFEKTIRTAMAEGSRITRKDGVASVVFAHKTTEGWEALLSGMIDGGWVISASWPIATELGSRLGAQDNASLATSVHLVCRPRTEDNVGDWVEVVRELPTRVADWMARLEREGVHGADLVFACIGPALEIFSRYSRVEKPDGSEVPLAEYLEKVWEVVGRTALEQVLGTAEAQARNGGLGALEEDSRLTAIFLWTLRATVDVPDDEEMHGDDEMQEGDEEEAPRKPAGLTLIYDIVRRFAQPLGIHLDAWKGRIIDVEKDLVRLLPVTQRATQLFGEAGAEAMANAIENDPHRAAQLELFPAEATETLKIKGRGRNERSAKAAVGHSGRVTTLDRVHAAMLLQRQGSIQP